MSMNINNWVLLIAYWIGIGLQERYKNHLWSKSIGHVYNIPTMQFFTGISRYTQSKSYMLSLTESVWEFRNNALWDTHQHVLLQALQTEKATQHISSRWNLSRITTINLHPVEQLRYYSPNQCYQHPDHHFWRAALSFHLCCLQSQHKNVVNCKQIHHQAVQSSNPAISAKSTFSAECCTDDSKRRSKVISRFMIDKTLFSAKPDHTVPLYWNIFESHHYNLTKDLSHCK